MRAFALTHWSSHLVQTLLKHAPLSARLRKDVSVPYERRLERERLRCVYHAHELQLYADISPVSVMHRRFKVATGLPQIKLATQEKMLCDYVMERCVGCIISVNNYDEGMVADEGGAALAIVPYVYDANNLVPAALEAAAALADSSLAVPLGQAHRHHAFFTVLRGDLHRRFNVLSDDTKQWKLAVLRLQLCGRAAGAGICRGSWTC